jgi:hypothetical protein
MENNKQFSTIKIHYILTQFSTNLLWIPNVSRASTTAGGARQEIALVLGRGRLSAGLCDDLITQFVSIVSQLVARPMATS